MNQSLATLQCLLLTVSTVFFLAAEFLRVTSSEDLIFFGAEMSLQDLKEARRILPKHLKPGAKVHSVFKRGFRKTEVVS